jgi:hypothetical protein
MKTHVIEETIAPTVLNGMRASHVRSDASIELTALSPDDISKSQDDDSMTVPLKLTRR